MATIGEVAAALEIKAPLALQESYDNSGLIAGNPSTKVTGVLVALDCTEEVIREAVKKKCNLVVSHHPIIFGGLKKLTGANYVERTVILAIENGVGIYALHTNLDSTRDGVNYEIARRLDLKDLKILRQMESNLKKIVTFCPSREAGKIRRALFNAGAGKIGAYDHCSFNASGEGTFRGDETTHPKVGVKGIDHTEPEIRIETIFFAHEQTAIVKALLSAHPYEEVAYDIYPLDNSDPVHGMGMIGELSKPMETGAFIKKLKTVFSLKQVRHTAFVNKEVSRIAVCGGSGSFLFPDAISNGADVFVTADIKYHQFFDADGKIVLADIGHHESEQFTTELIGNYLKEKFTTFATHFSRVNTNPIIYS